MAQILKLIFHQITFYWILSHNKYLGTENVNHSSTFLYSECFSPFLKSKNPYRIKLPFISKLLGSDFPYQFNQIHKPIKTNTVPRNMFNNKFHRRDVILYLCRYMTHSVNLFLSFGQKTFFRCEICNSQVSIFITHSYFFNALDISKKDIYF